MFLLKNSQRGVYQTLWNKMGNMPEVVDTPSAMKHVKRGTHAFMDDRTHLEFFALGDCSFSLADETFNKAGYGFVLQEHSPYLDKFSLK